MLNKMKIVLAGAAAVAAMSSSAAYAETEPAVASVEILKVVSISAVSDLNFGVIAASSGGGTVELAASASAVPNATGVTYIRGGAPASFTVTDASNGEVIEFSTRVLDALRGAGDPIPLSGLTLSQSTLTYNAAATTQPLIYVGGTISVGVNQVGGTYLGSFEVTADYQ